MLSGVVAEYVQLVSGSGIRYSVRARGPPRNGNSVVTEKVSPGWNWKAASENVEPMVGWPCS